MTNKPSKPGPFGSAAELESKLRSQQNVLNAETVKVRRIKEGTHYNGGRPVGSKDLPPFLREVVGLTALRDGPVAAARAFGLNRNTAEAAKFGATHYGREVDEGLKATMDEARLKIRANVIDTATQKLLASVGLIDETELAGLGPVKQAQVASSLAGVVERLGEKKEAGSQVNVGVVVYSPNPKDEGQFPVVEVVSQAK